MPVIEWILDAVSTVCPPLRIFRSNRAGQIRDQIAQNFMGEVRTSLHSLVKIFSNTPVLLEAIQRACDKNLQALLQLVWGTDAISHEVHGVQIILKSIANSTMVHQRFMELAVLTGLHELRKMNDTLGKIQEELNHTKRLQAQGSGGPDGFAQHVYDLIRMRIDEVGNLQDHRFFVSHRNTDWYPAFHKLIKQRQLPVSFCARSDNLDGIVLSMLSMREHLTATLGDERSKEITFHLLMPTSKSVYFEAPLHFPDDLAPLRVEGEISNGQADVHMNLPRAPKDLLHGVENVLGSELRTAVARGTGTAATVGLFSVFGRGTMAAAQAMAALARVTAIAARTTAAVTTTPPVAIPVASTSFTETSYAIKNGGMKRIKRMGEAVHDLIAEERPRILGSNERLRSRLEKLMFPKIPAFEICAAEE